MDDERSPLEVPIEDAATIAALANYGLHASDHVSFDESGKDIFISVLEEVNAYDDESNHSNIPSMHTSIAHNLAQPQDMSQCMSHIMPSMSLSDRSENAHHINVSSCVSSAPSVAVNVDGRPMTIYEEDCNSVRQKISLLLSSKIMTQLDFLKEIGCSTDSLSRFMKLKGTWCGTNNSGTHTHLQACLHIHAYIRMHTNACILMYTFTHNSSRVIYSLIYVTLLSTRM